MNWDHLVISGNSHAGVNLDLLPVKNIERIEIVRGPASSLYGSDAVGGIINIITRKAKTPSTSISSEFGSWGLRRYSLTTEGRENGIGYLITAEKKKRDNFEYKNATTGKTVTKQDSKLDQEYLTMKLDKEFSNGNSLILEVEHGNDESDFGGNSSYPYPGAYRKVVDNNIALSYHWGQDKGADNFFRVYRNTSNQEYFKALSDSFAKLYANGFNWQESWQLSKGHTLTGGADWREEHIDDRKSIDNGYTNKALFLENRWQLANKWSVTAGTRYDDHSIVGDNFSSRITVNKEVNPTTNVYASWGQYVKNPTIAELFSNTQYWIGNPNLKPEEGTTTTLGINTKLGDGTKLQASIYSSRLKNAIEWKGFWPLPDPGYYYNVSQEKRQGLDLNLSRQLSPQWNVGVGYTYNKTKIKDVGYSDYVADPYNSQPNGYRLNVQYDQDKWDASLTLRSATGRNKAQFTSKSYVTLDLMANYKITSDTHVYLKGYNLTNKAYELSSANGLGVAGAYPMPGRNFYIGVEHRM
jgi:vitamin B12 transporter